MLAASTKISQASLQELERRVEMEVYLREKKAAILVDRQDTAD